MDGLAATRRIRMTEVDGARIPIVGLTAGSGAERIAACLEAGMDAATTKPVTLSRLRTALAEGLSASGQHVVATGSETTTPRLRELAEMLGEDAVAEIVRTFAEDVQATLDAMKRAVSRGDSQTVGRTAHSVAGAARNVGAGALAARASELEQTAGCLSVAQVAAEVAAMQTELDGMIDRLGIRRGWRLV